MDYEAIIHAFIDSIVTNKEALLIRELPNESKKDITLLIVAENEDTARLIGRRGIIANALREVIAIAGKIEGKRVHLKFESFDTKSQDDD
jgi:uncharacterized protein